MLSTTKVSVLCFNLSIKVE